MVSRKIFDLRIELDVFMVTCPGVWLYPQGTVTLRVRTLQSSAMTAQKHPVFPIVYNERLIFQKALKRITSLESLHKMMISQTVILELLQWPSQFPTARGLLLAVFNSSLSNFLFPSKLEKGLFAGIDIEVLMTPTEAFPGVLGPKVRIGTKTFVKEITTKCPVEPGYAVINPKMISSTHKSNVKDKKKRKHKGIIAVSAPSEREELRTKDLLPKSREVRDCGLACDCDVVCKVCEEYCLMFSTRQADVDESHKDNDDKEQKCYKRDCPYVSMPYRYEEPQNQFERQKVEAVVHTKRNVFDKEIELLKMKTGCVPRGQRNYLPSYHVDFYSSLEQFYRELYERAKTLKHNKLMSLNG